MRLGDGEPSIWYFGGHNGLGLWGKHTGVKISSSCAVGNRHFFLEGKSSYNSSKFDFDVMIPIDSTCKFGVNISWVVTRSPVFSILDFEMIPSTNGTLYGIHKTHFIVIRDGQNISDYLHHWVSRHKKEYNLGNTTDFIGFLNFNILAQRNRKVAIEDNMVSVIQEISANYIDLQVRVGETSSGVSHVATPWQVPWMDLSIQALDITSRDDFSRSFGSLKIDRIVAEHVFEHLSLAEAVVAASNCLTYLRHGGSLRVAVPDINWSLWHKKNDTSNSSDILTRGQSLSLREYYQAIAETDILSRDISSHHRIQFTSSSLQALLKAVGFEVHVMEATGPTGVVFTDPSFSPERGLIRRSSVGSGVPSSIVVDGIKPFLTKTKTESSDAHASSGATRVVLFMTSLAPCQDSLGLYCWCAGDTYAVDMWKVLLPALANRFRRLRVSFTVVAVTERCQLISNGMDSGEEDFVHMGQNEMAQTWENFSLKLSQFEDERIPMTVLVPFQSFEVLKMLNTLSEDMARRGWWSDYNKVIVLMLERVWLDTDLIGNIREALHPAIALSIVTTATAQLSVAYPQSNITIVRTRPGYYSPHFYAGGADVGDFLATITSRTNSSRSSDDRPLKFLVLLNLCPCDCFSDLSAAICQACRDSLDTIKIVARTLFVASPASLSLNVVLSIVGGCPIPPSLSSLLSDFDLPWVQFPGDMDAEMRRLLLSSSAGLVHLPAHILQVSAVMEAVAVGCPVLLPRSPQSEFLQTSEYQSGIDLIDDRNSTVDLWFWLRMIIHQSPSIDVGKWKKSYMGWMPVVTAIVNSAVA